MLLSNTNITGKAIKRVQVWYGVLLIVLGVFVIQLFYIQIIQYGHYKAAALSDQLKQWDIPATRGVIEAHEGDAVVPIVLNQRLFTLFADPPYIKNANQMAQQVTNIIGGDASNYTRLMQTKNTQYVVLANKLTEDQQARITALKDPGLGTQEQDYRVYPQGSLASQILGFVNNSGHGQYGIEQTYNKQLSGQDGKLKAITDANGVPLPASKDNTDVAPVNGKNVVLSLDLSMQSQMESILSNEYKKTNSQGLSAIIMDVNTGKIRAMANYPTYDPSNYENVSNSALFQDAAVTNAIEPGSSMKLLTTAAALDLGVIQPDTSFYDPAHWLVDGFNITDIEEDGGARTQNIASILNLSLNTGATWMLMQMGGGQINLKAREAWYNYLTSHYRLNKPTGIEPGYEAIAGVTPPQDNGAGIDLTYANMSFGQGIQLSALQMAAAVASILNGGTYYQPQLVDQLVSPNGQTTSVSPKVLGTHVVSSKVSQEMVPLMQYVVQQHLAAGFPYMNFDPAYTVGGKTGTAQIAQPGGGYYANKYNGTYIGFVGGDKPQYVIVVFNMQPNVPGYAGSYGGQPVFADLAHMMINNGFVDRRTH